MPCRWRTLYAHCDDRAEQHPRINAADVPLPRVAISASQRREQGIRMTAIHRSQHASILPGAAPRPGQGWRGACGDRPHGWRPVGGPDEHVAPAEYRAPRLQRRAIPGQVSRCAPRAELWGFRVDHPDNASTDDTSEICRDYESRDPRVRYCRQPRNIGSSPNHIFVVEEARGEFFKWASYDDLYARIFSSVVSKRLTSTPTPCSPTPGRPTSTRPTRSSLRRRTRSRRTRRWPPSAFGAFSVSGGDDIYAVIRTSTLRRVLPQDSYHHAEHPIVAALCLHGPFVQVPEWLYFRRDHPQQAERACTTMRSRCANMDPRRENRLRHPVARLYAEYLWGYVKVIHRAPLTSTERFECYGHLRGGWPTEQPGLAFRRASTSRRAFPPGSTSRPWSPVRLAESDRGSTAGVRLSDRIDQR